MAKKEVPIAGGKITVTVQDKYDVYEKPLPAGLDTNVNWLGNFGISEKATGKKLNGKVPKYVIEVLDVAGKKLYYWNGTEKKEVPGQNTITKKGKNFRKGELDLGDPPIGLEK
jgi:hypothetical protein